MMSVRELDQYPTPLWVAEALVARHFPDLDSGDCVLEPACGPGRFLRAIPAHVPAVGVELDPALAAAARRATGREVITGDFTEVALDLRPTALIGNPPFRLALIDQFLARAYRLLPSGGRCGFILPAYMFQTAARVARYNADWGLTQEMIPRNIYPGLKLPLMFALFAKDRQQMMVGLALYHEAAQVQAMHRDYQAILREGGRTGSLWRDLVAAALHNLKGRAHLSAIYAELKFNRPRTNRAWKEQIRKVARQHFTALGEGWYALPETPAAEVAA